MAIYDVRNNGNSNAVLHDLRGKRVLVRAGGVAENVHLSDVSVERVARDKSLEIQVVSEQEQAPSSETETAIEKVVETREVEPTGEELIAEYESGQIQFHQLLTGAKKILGDAWPGGTPKRSAIFKLLRS